MMPIAFIFLAASAAYHLPPGLLKAVCAVESGLDSSAMNHFDGGSKSIGICQIKLQTARQLGFKGSEIDLKRPATNIKYAAKYLKFQLDRYSGRITPAVAAYNAGSYIERKRGGPVNAAYVDKVIQAWIWREDEP